MYKISFFLAGFVVMCASPAFAQHACRFYAQNPSTINATDAQNFELEVEIDFTNVGTSTWQNTGGVTNLNYIELRPVGNNGLPIDGPLYHTSWINRQRVGSFLSVQQGVAPQQVARFVFKVQINGAALGIGTHYCYFRPYHAQGGYITDWGDTRITVVVTASTVAPAPAPTPAPAPAPNPGPTTLVADITRAAFERSQVGSSGSYVETYNLATQPAVDLRQYHTLNLTGAVYNGTTTAHEWSVWQNGNSRLLGTAQSLVTQSQDLFIGPQELRYRARDANGNWSSFDTLSFRVEPWPKLMVPVHGTWIWNGNDYGRGDHHYGDLYAQDWNAPTGGHTDFGLEMIAAMPGVAAIAVDVNGGRIVDIIHDDPVMGKFRARYMHLSSVLVRDGKTVQRGQPIGLCGDTGAASSYSHLHYSLQKWVNGAWQAVAPEPCWVNDQTVRQVIRYGDTINADTRRLPPGVLILPEQAVSAAGQDAYGYGQTKHWSATVASLQPTASATWDFIIPADGVWKLWAHNPSGVTNSNSGLATHNSTSAAVFEVSRPRVLGYQTHRIDQNAGIKGGLIEICEMDVVAGDRVFVRQHNATGETGREISFDELVVTLETPAGSGGSAGSNTGSSSGGGSSGGGTSSPPPPSSPAPSGGNAPSGSPSGVTATSGNTYTNPPPPMSGGGGGGGCAMSNANGNRPGWLVALILLLILHSCSWARRARSPTLS